MNTEELLETLSARAQFYRMLASLYFRPITAEELDAMAAQDFSELREGADESLMAEGYDDMFRYLRKRNTGSRQELACDFTQVFSGAEVLNGRQGMPYESLFRDKSGLLMQGPRNEVYHTFREASVEIRDGLDLPEDHLSFEFEFMALLCDRAAAARKANDAEGFDTNLHTQQKFFDMHIASWFDDLYDIAMQMVQTRFYRGVLKVTKGFIEEEPEVMAELAACVK